MSYLNRITRHPKSRTRIRRVGRGPGSGRGKTSGKGHKGQGQHGKPPRPGWEGGQMPLMRTTPKRGFTARSKPTYQVLNLNVLAAADAAVIDAAYLFKHKLIDSRRVPVKILGDGEVKKAIHVKADAFSKSAAEKIEKAGGRCEKVGAAAAETKQPAAPKAKAAR